MAAAAVRAAILAKAPRRTVAAVAGAIACVFGRPATAPAQQPVQRSPAETSAHADAGPAGSSPEELLAALRSARTAQRRRKKTRQAARKAGGRDAIEVREQPAEPGLGGGLAPSLPQREEDRTDGAEKGGEDGWSERRGQNKERKAEQDGEV